VKIAFFLPPTGLKGEHYFDHQLDRSFPDDVIRVYLESCIHPKIGNGLFFPDFNIVSKAIRNSFEKNTQSIDILQLRRHLGSGIYTIISEDTPQTPIQIESILLTGYSRGAATLPIIAKAIDELGIPIDIVADRPVPGKGSQWANPSESDLSSCKNIRSATTIMAAHHRYNGHGFLYPFFNQLLPRYPADTKSQCFMIPYHWHFDPPQSPYIFYHIYQAIKNQGYFKSTHNNDVEPEVFLKGLYEQNDSTPYLKNCFPPRKFLQPILGSESPIPKDQMYLTFMNQKATKIAGKEITNGEVALTICSIDSSTIPPDQKKTMMEFVQSEADNALKLRAIINEIEETCAFLTQITFDKIPMNQTAPTKAERIQTHSADYKKNVFQLCFDYLKNQNPSEPDKKTLIEGIKAAQRSFEKKALNIDRGIGRKILWALTNFILLVSGLGIFAFVLNKKKTGDYLFFSHTRSTSIMRNTLSEVLGQGPIHFGKH